MRTPNRMMKPTAALQEKLYKEMVGHIKETDETVPYRGEVISITRAPSRANSIRSIARKKAESRTAKEEVVAGPE